MFLQLCPTSTTTLLTLTDSLHYVVQSIKYWIWWTYDWLICEDVAIGHTLGWIPVGSQPKCVVDSCNGLFRTLQKQLVQKSNFYATGILSLGVFSFCWNFTFWRKVLDGGSLLLVFVCTVFVFVCKLLFFWFFLFVVWTVKGQTDKVPCEHIPAVKCLLCVQFQM